MENLTGGTPPVRYLLCVVPCKLYFGSFKTFEVKDIDGEQFYRLYPISNDGAGVIFNDLKMDSSYDEDEENLDNILITIKFK